ncbi:MAG: tRNA guanosine(34) transglycosylase Tgt [Cytophagales bacterium]
MKFTIKSTDPKSNARSAELVLPHGVVPTPVFMPVGTQATVKAVHQRELRKDLDAKIILGNTYHLYMRPGMKVLQEAGGVHKFMGWDRPMLTDSGGYQVYSLAQSRHITEEGVLFKSIFDGSQHLFTPEKAMEYQFAIGADIIMAFDECTPFPCSYDYAKRSMERTHRWLTRCIKHLEITKPHYGYSQSLFPIVQGGIYKDLRKHSAQVITAADQPGNAIGGVCHPTGQLYEVTDWVCNILPRNKPRYLMGVGTPKDLLECIALGVDMFDCVMPARNARNGYLFTTQGILHIKNRKWKYDFTTIDPHLDNYASQQHTKAYLHHLLRVGERLGAQIATLHNLAFYDWLMASARRHIQQGDFVSWKDEILPRIMRKM